MDTVEADDDVERLLSRVVVAQRLDCDPQTVTKMARAGRFVPPILVGNLLRWRERDVNAWIAERAAAAAAKSLEPAKRSGRG